MLGKTPKLSTIVFLHVNLQTFYNDPTNDVLHCEKIEIKVRSHGIMDKVAALKSLVDYIFDGPGINPCLGRYLFFELIIYLITLSLVFGV